MEQQLKRERKAAQKPKLKKKRAAPARGISRDKAKSRNAMAALKQARRRGALATRGRGGGGKEGHGSDGRSDCCALVSP